MRPRYGFTLVETLIVVVLLGMMVLIAFPKVSAAMGRNELRGARTTMINMVAAARAAAVQTNRVTWIKFEGNTAHVLARPRLDGLNPPNGADTVGAVRDFSEQYKVTLTFGEDSIQFDPRGFGTDFGGITTIGLSRYGYSSTITIDGLGRVQK